MGHTVYSCIVLSSKSRGSSRETHQSKRCDEPIPKLNDWRSECDNIIQPLPWISIVSHDPEERNFRKVRGSTDVEVMISLASPDLASLTHCLSNLLGPQLIVTDRSGTFTNYQLIFWKNKLKPFLHRVC